MTKQLFIALQLVNDSLLQVNKICIHISKTVSIKSLCPSTDERLEMPLRETVCWDLFYGKITLMTKQPRANVQ